MAWWYKKNALAFLFYPLSLIFLGIIKLRRFCYQAGIYKTHRLACPVIIVGNITVGGTGKTPLVLYLAERLQQAGYHPLVITRGYKGENNHWPIRIKKDSDPMQMGDEAVLLAQRVSCPVFAGPDRVATAELALSQCQNPEKAVIISDDGLQHFRLARDIEIAVFDGERWLGNGFLLPAGPLREPASRLATVDFQVIQGGQVNDTEAYTMTLQGECLVSLQDEQQNQSISAWQGQTVHAVAAIGNPERFFKSLENHGLEVIRHPFPDHFSFKRSDIEFNDARAVVMTEKDAVKCRQFADEQHYYLPVETVLDNAFLQQILARLNTGAP